MNKVVKIIIIIVIIDALILLGYFYFRSRSSQKSQPETEEYEWITVDEFYTPKDYVEEFIKSDSITKGLLPVFIRNYGKNKSILRKFRGSNFAGPTDAQLNMMYNGLADWKLVDLKYKPKENREVIRTILYVNVKGTWSVGDSGKLVR